METKKPGAWPTKTEPSWTDESLPLDLRRGLLDRALDQIKASKGLAPHGHPASQDSPDHPGDSGAESSNHND